MIRSSPRALALGVLCCFALACDSGSERPPNIVLVVVDTLRADRLSCYGAERDTSPGLCERLAERGVLFERAYAQAPWTLPSMASLLTGRFPDELGLAGSTLFDIPESVSSLAERLQRAGYQTAAFVANPTLQPQDGYARGFDRFEITPPEIESLSLHAEDRLQPWLEEWLGEQHDQAHENEQDAPFFLWAHYLDPHDPYDNPRLAAGEGFVDPETEGVGGGDVHSVYAGVLEVDEEVAAARFGAFYDSEIRYVDDFVSALLDGLAERDLENTLIVLTSDHGEEFFEHHGWKHGQALYEEQVRVPLLVSWPGQAVAGLRVEETVRLADIAPTLLEAAGVEADDLTGQSLVPVLRGERSPAERPAFFQHLSNGPLRAGAVLGERKLVLFNARDDRTEEDPLARHLLARDRERLPAVAVFDLGTDPLEQRPRSTLTLADRELESEIHRRLLGTVAGTRVLVDGVVDGDLFELVLAVEAPAVGDESTVVPADLVVPYFLDEADRYRVAETERGAVTVALEITGSPGAPLRGLLLGENVKLVRVHAARGTLRLGSGRPVPLPAETPGDYDVRSWVPERSESPEVDEPAVYVFRPRRGAESEEPSDAVRERLKTLGYVE